MAISRPLARSLPLILATSGLLLLIGPALGMLAPEWLPGPWPSAGATTQPERQMLQLSILPSYVVLAIGFAGVVGFARQLARGQVFAGSAAAPLSWFGACVLLASLLLPIGRLTAGWMMGQGGSWLGPAQLMVATTGLSLGLLILAFASILRDASRLAAENAEFI